ncbi:hypothetical protein NIES208_07540 [[Limnothrix rosea] IAM M-220]|nr:hypothetical protein NIES208_07540 [[Limnothrix rosea] IAM M-220]
MLEKVPPSHRYGATAKDGAQNTKRYLVDKDVSHINPHSKGGSGNVDNLLFENRGANRARGAKKMTPKEQGQIHAQARVENLTGALKAGVQAASKGAVIGAISTAPFAMLHNGLRVVRGEISAEDACKESLKETAIGAGVGAVSAFGVTTVMAACPPIAAALVTLSPALLAVGGAGMVKQFFGILASHKEKTKEYYESLTQQDLDYLKKLEADLEYEHKKSLRRIEESRVFHQQLSERPVHSGIAAALQRYQESAALAEAHGGKPIGAKALLPNQQRSLSSSSEEA